MELRSDTDEEQADLVNELLSVTVRYCSPHRLIW
jgi:hypothetical protein